MRAGGRNVGLEGGMLRVLSLPWGSVGENGVGTQGSVFLGWLQNDAWLSVRRWGALHPLSASGGSGLCLRVPAGALPRGVRSQGAFLQSQGTGRAGVSCMSLVLALFPCGCCVAVQPQGLGMSPYRGRISPVGLAPCSRPAEGTSSGVHAHGEMDVTPCRGLGMVFLLFLLGGQSVLDETEVSLE